MFPHSLRHHSDIIIFNIDNVHVFKLCKLVSEIECMYYDHYILNSFILWWVILIVCHCKFLIQVCHVLMFLYSILNNNQVFEIKALTVPINGY